MDTQANQPLASFSGVTKHFSGFTLGPISLTIPGGAIVGLVGENGAGKTTSLKLLSGVSKADAGSITLPGGVPCDVAARAKIGVVFEDAYFYERLNAVQVGKSMQGVFGAAWDAPYYQALLARFTLDATKPMKEFSRGMRMKLALAAALAHHPQLLILDEATSGLDPVMRGELMDLLLDFIKDEQHSVLLSTHITADLAQVADSIAYLHRGQLVFQADKDTLLEEYGLLRCSASELTQLAPSLVVHTRHSSYGCESLVKDRHAVQDRLPGAVCDPATIDDIMRFYSGRDAQ